MSREVLVCVAAGAVSAGVAHACCKRHAPGPVFTQFADEPAPEFICPECGGRWVWDDDEAEGGAWYWDPENDDEVFLTGRTVGCSLTNTPSSWWPFGDAGGSNGAS